jgi:maleate isomerase
LLLCFSWPHTDRMAPPPAEPPARPPLLQTGIGIVAPYDFALDRELWRWVPDDVSLYLTRMPYVPQATVEMAMHISEPQLVARSAIDVLAVSPLVTAYACTSGSFIHGLAGEKALVTAMKEAGAPAAVTTYETTTDLVRDTDNPDAEAVFLSCTNLPTYDVIATLEREIGKPVLTANQVTMWASLTLAGRPAVGPGQLLCDEVLL